MCVHVFVVCEFASVCVQVCVCVCVQVCVLQRGSVQVSLWER